MAVLSSKRPDPERIAELEQSIERLERALRESQEELAVAREIFFTLRAQDQIAPDTVLHWILRAEEEGVAEEKIEEVRTILREMRAWQQANPHLVKLPD